MRSSKSFGARTVIICKYLLVLHLGHLHLIRFLTGKATFVHFISHFTKGNSCLNLTLGDILPGSSALAAIAIRVDSFVI